MSKTYVVPGIICALHWLWIWIPKIFILQFIFSIVPAITNRVSSGNIPPVVEIVAIRNSKPVRVPMFRVSEIE